jgi:hypothetical protein
MGEGSWGSVSRPYHKSKIFHASSPWNTPGSSTCSIPASPGPTCRCRWGAPRTTSAPTCCGRWEAGTPGTWTEDADLGIRLALAGWRVGDLPSSTHEEAPQALAVDAPAGALDEGLPADLRHPFRHPVRCVRALGFVRFLAAVTLTAARCSRPALPGPHRGVAHGPLDREPAPGPHLAGGRGGVLEPRGLRLRAVAMIGPGMAGAMRRGWWRLAPQSLMLPVYYVLVSLAPGGRSTSSRPIRPAGTRRSTGWRAPRGAGGHRTESRSFAASSGGRLRLKVRTKRFCPSMR